MEKAKKEETYDLIIFGAGIAGCSSAVAFANQGRSVLLIERDLKEPDRIIGELLQPGGVKALEDIGIKNTINGIDGIETDGYAVIYDKKACQLPYPLLNKNDPSSTATGIAFHHGRFITNLRNAAKKNPNITLIEATVTDLLYESEQVIGVKTVDKFSNKKNYHSALTIVCDGIFSNFRNKFKHKSIVRNSHFVALELIDAKLPFPNHGHVIMGDVPPVLLYQIGTHETRALVAINGKTLPSISNGDLKKYLELSVLPSLPKSVQPSFKQSLDKETFRSMPNSFLTASRIRQPGVVLLGDSFNMRHPLTGGGMTVAFKDVVTLSKSLSPENVSNFNNIDLVQERVDVYYSQRKKYAIAINTLAYALYAIFAAEDSTMKILQKGCFKYFELGGRYVEGPISLSSGLCDSYMVLVYHFFAVAIYSIICNYREKGLSGFLVAFIDMFRVIWKASCLILPYLFREIFA